ncbi:lipopolysaccharide biosynthesis protein [Pseudosporangium ferrugineum]|uniref:PST family polysaccharide transporter n=1 Tax=Pseudosporangium ferrugineum TaxID=439699 RepID=A0A2T0SF47_9ACTN|nr:lipopolysaccharide biosynthesis protein [Pseudosporangium ferrugineum]PRY32037.1 PST family polysaccharide transporter [Pseudosporangium ferrugineum]
MRLGIREDAPLIAKAGRAVGWSFASTAIGKLSTLAIGIALARLLGPAEFGTFAVAMVALLAVLSFNELGVSLAIVRWPGDPREIAPTVATISAGTSLLVYAGCFAGAPAFATAMGDPRAAPLVRVLALSVVISGLVATPVALLQREFRQDRKTVADLVTNWGSALTSIACALSGMGAMSLAVGQLTGAAAGAVLFFRYAPQGLRFGFDRRQARALLKFGLPLAGSSIVVFAVANVDRVLVGALLGPVPLGYYVLAANLSNWPVSVFSQPVRAVAPAALARLQGDPRAMRRTFLSTAGLLAAITLPACAVLAGVATPLIRLVYGAVWQPAATVLVWLVLLAALRILFELVYDYFVVLADTRVVFTVQVVWLLALIPALYAGATTAGLAGAGAAQLAVAGLVVLPIYLWELRRAGVPPARLGARLALPVAGAAVAAAVCVAAVLLGPPDPVVLAVGAVAGAGALAALGYRLRGELRELRTAPAAPGPAEPVPA